MVMVKEIIFRMEILKEGEQYISLCPELNVSSFGNTVEEAKKALKEAVELFLEECQEIGTLEEVLEEAGFSHISKPEERWVTQEPIVEETVTLVGG